MADCDGCDKCLQSEQCSHILRTLFTNSKVMSHMSTVVTADRSTTLSIAAATSLVTAGLSIAIYALTAFTDPEWTFAAPGLAVAVAGIIGLRTRWAFLAGPVPLSAVLTVAGKVTAFDLARPGETAYFVGSVFIAMSACFAAVLGVTAALAPWRRWLVPGATVLSAVTCVAVLAIVVGGNDASAATDDGISAAERQGAVVIELVDYRFVPAGPVTDGGVVLLRNTGSLPHQLDVPGTDVAVFVPSGRETYVRLPTTGDELLGVICPVGDHAQRGMGLNIPLVTSGE